MTRVVLVPGALALLPEYAGIEDPLADLRAACLDAVGWLGTDVKVLADAQGARVADHLLAATTRSAEEPSYLVVGNGSACRTDKAPGHLDERAADFDADLGRRLAEPGSLTAVDAGLARELWASVDEIRRLAEIPRLAPVAFDYDDDPYGVQYWVVRWAS